MVFNWLDCDRMSKISRKQTENHIKTDGKPGITLSFAKVTNSAHACFNSAHFSFAIFLKPSIYAAFWFCDCRTKQKKRAKPDENPVFPGLRTQKRSRFSPPIEILFWGRWTLIPPHQKHLPETRMNKGFRKAYWWRKWALKQISRACRLLDGGRPCQKHHRNRSHQELYQSTILCRRI